MTRGWGTIRERKDGSFLASVYVGGRRERKVFPKKGLADDWLEVQRGRKAVGDAGGPMPGTDEDVTVAELIPPFERYLAEHPERTYSDRTRASYASEFKAVARRLGSRRMLSVRTADLTAWATELRRDGASSSKIRHYLDRVSQLRRFAVDQGYIRDEPLKIRRPRSVPTRAPRATSEDDLGRLLEHAAADWDRRALVVVLLAADAGLRAAEVAQLRPGDVDLAARQLRLETRDLASDRTKAGRYRVVPVLSRRLRDALGAALAFAPAGGRLLGAKDRETLYGVVQRAWTAAGLTGAPRLHELRRRFATDQHRRGTPLDLIRQWLGHRDLRTTGRYIVIDPGAVPAGAGDWRGPRTALAHRGSTGHAQRKSRNAR